MSRQFSQESFYEEPKPHLWQRLLPVFIVLCAGAMAYYLGNFVGEHLTQRISNLDAGQTSEPIVQRAVIGEDDPEIMMPSATSAPLPIVVPSNGDDKQSAPRRASISPKPKTQPVLNPFQDDSIPFRPAEDYPPGVEYPLPSDAESTKHNHSAATPLPDTPVPSDQSSKQTKQGENPSPIPVPEGPTAKQ